MPIKITQRGSFDQTENYLRRLENLNLRPILEHYGDLGVAALANATPIDSSLTANSWYYDILQNKNYWALHWHNTNEREGVPIVILIEYGHATRNGGFVQARPFIMDAIGPVIEQANEAIMKEVTKD